MKLACLALVLLLACGCASMRTGPEANHVIAPAALPRRAIAETPLPGRQIALRDSHTNQFTLFLPDGWQVPASGKVVLTVHFHGAVWFAIQEHLRHGLKTPLLAAYLGEGSSVYRRPFEDTNRFAEWLDLVTKEISKHAESKRVRITSVDISSFSAGYGAVRELVKSPRYFTLIRRIVLCDSLYGSLQNTNPAATRVPAPEHVSPWIPFAEAAARGKKTFLLTHSEVSTSYASTAEMARALIAAVDARRKEQSPLPAVDDPQYRLRYRSDRGRFHVWGYSGIDAPAHLTHVRHLAEFWTALDQDK